MDRAQNAAGKLATALTTAARAGSWPQLRGRIAEFLREHGVGQHQPVLTALDGLARDTATAGAADRDQVARKVTMMLHALLRARLLEDPALSAAVDSLRADVESLSRVRPEITQHADARDDARIYQAGGNIGNIGGQP
nr:hypothetical protein OHB51_23465 [Micromonospora sp. NBC_00855]